MRYQVLGPLEAAADAASAGLGGPKQRLVLAVLLIEAGRVVSDDRLVDEVWADEPPDAARHAIQVYVSELRRALDDEIRREGNGYRLLVDRESIDGYRFETLVAAGRDRMADAPVAAAALFREGLDLWHGEPYGGVAEAPMLAAEIHRLNDLRLAAVEDRIGAELDAGLHAQVVPELAALSREHPYRERLHALHMLALYRSDRQADALRAYHRARRWLVGEMGIDPSPDLQALERRILDQDPELASPPMAATGVGMAPGGAGTPGVELLRGFELRERVGGDGTRATFHAYQPSVGREVAISVVRGDAVQHPRYMRFFDLRARRIAELDHPHIVPLLDWWRDPDGAYVVTPWIRGGSAGDAGRRGAWSLAQTLRVVEGAGGALTAAHRRGVLHAALTPSAILLDGEGNALLTGFSMAEEGAAGRDCGPMAAPELRRGETPTVASDVWALAMVTIGLLTGTDPSPDAPAQTLSQRRTDLSADLVAVLAQATSPMSSDRQERVTDFLRDLRRAAGADVVAPPEPDDRPDTVRNPYKGLQAFTEADAPDFFGRGALVDRLVGTLADRRFVALAGPSGSGKSSAVRAGLVPALRANRLAGARDWLVTDMFPGPYPFEELASALRRIGVTDPGEIDGFEVGGGDLAATLKRVLPPDGHLLLFIDQFEELWSLTDDAELRRRFIDGLVAAVTQPASRLHIVVACRTDFLDLVLEVAGLADLARSGLVLVTPPTADELAQAITQPARAAGLELEPGLLDSIIRDVADEPGALPLLQHALTELFVLREGRRLTRAGYRRSGGVAGALGRRAEEVYRNLPPGAHEVARQVFLRLVTVDEQHDDTRRRVRRAELAALPASPGVIDRVLHEFGAHRLLAFDRDAITRGPTVEVAHEALFRAWGTLRGWIEARHEDLIRHRGLRTATRDWVSSERSPDYLYGGGRLEEAERWQSETDLGVTADERGFLAASRAREDAVTAGRRRRRRLALAGTSGAALVAIGLAAIAFLQLGRAEAGEQEAHIRALAAESRAQEASDQDLALLLAEEAVQVSTRKGQAPLPEAIDALHAALVQHRVVSTSETRGVMSLLLADDLAFSGGPDNPPVLWSQVTGKLVRGLEPSDRPFDGAAASADGRVLAEATRPGSRPPVIVWDVTSGRVIAEVGTPGLGAASPSLSADGSRVAYVEYRLDARGAPDCLAGGCRGIVYDMTHGRQLADVALSQAAFLKLSSAGGRLAVWTPERAIVELHDVEDGRSIQVGTGKQDDAIADVAFDPSGETVALYAANPTRIVTASAIDGTVTHTISISGEPAHLCFMADGRTVVATAADEFAHVVRVDSGAEFLRLPASARTLGIDCAGVGDRVAVTVGDLSTRIYDVGPLGSREVAGIASGPAPAGHWLPDGSLLVAEGTTLHRYAGANGGELAHFDGLNPDFHGWLAVSPDGSVVAVATGGPQPATVLLDATTLSRRQSLGGPAAPLDFSPDGSFLLTGGRWGWAVYDVASGTRRFNVHEPAAGEEFFAPAGIVLADSRHALLREDGFPGAWIYDVTDGRLAGTLCAKGPGRGIATSSDRRIVALIDFDLVELHDADRLLAAAAPGASCDAETAEPPGSFMRSVDIARFAEVQFSPDGQRIGVASSLAGTLSVVSVAGESPGVTIPLGGNLSLVGFTPDSRELSVGLDNGQADSHAVQTYTLDVPDLLHLAEARVTRTWTDEECRTYLQLDSCP